MSSFHHYTLRSNQQMDFINPASTFVNRKKAPLYLLIYKSYISSTFIIQES